jgi:hypothetical protein
MTCSKCGSDVADNLARCPCCGTDAGFPNVKMASADAAMLAQRAGDARLRADTRGAGSALTEFAQAVNASHAVANVDVDFLHKLLTDEKTLYTAYGKLIAAGARAPASVENDQQRTAVDGLLFGVCGAEIAYAALALDGRGLGSYGLVSLELRDVALAERASVLEENGYFFVQRHRIVPGDLLPGGYRAPWNTRREVAVAKLADRINAATTPSEHARLLLSSDGVDRRKDDFVEVHIYGPFNRRAIERITVLVKPASPQERQRLKGVRKTAKQLGIAWNE